MAPEMVLVSRLLGSPGSLAPRPSRRGVFVLGLGDSRAPPPASAACSGESAPATSSAALTTARAPSAAWRQHPLAASPDAVAPHLGAFVPRSRTSPRTNQDARFRRPRRATATACARGPGSPLRRRRARRGRRRARAAVRRGSAAPEGSARGGRRGGSRVRNLLLGGARRGRGRRRPSRARGRRRAVSRGYYERKKYLRSIFFSKNIRMPADDRDFDALETDFIREILKFGSDPHREISKKRFFHLNCRL